MRRLTARMALAAAAATFAGGPIKAQPPGHGFHPPMPDQQFYLQCRLEPGDGREPVSVEVPLQLPSLMSPAELNQTVTLPGAATGIVAKRFLPRASLEQRVAADPNPSARPVIELAIEGPTQSYRRWLLADDAERNRLVSFIGTWRYLAVANGSARDALYEQFQNELVREPKLVVRKVEGGAAREVPVQQGGKAVALDDLGCRVRVISFYPDYALDEKSHKPVNRSDQRVNPAALVEIERDGTKEERWVFAKFPDFAPRTSRLPYKLDLDCPLQPKGTAPDFVIGTVGLAKHEVWKRYEGKTTAQPAAIDERINVSGSQYSFRIAQFVAAGRLVEEYVPADREGTVSALQLEVANAETAANPVWLEAGKPRAIATPNGFLTIAFGTWSASGEGFRAPAARSPHSQSPASHP